MTEADRKQAVSLAVAYNAFNDATERKNRNGQLVWGNAFIQAAEALGLTERHLGALTCARLIVADLARDRAA